MAGRPLRRARLAAENAVLEFGPLSPRPNPLQRDISNEHPILDYNDPNIKAKNFLYAIMWDKTVDLKLRIEAAEHLMQFTEAMPATVYVSAPPSNIPSVTIRIETPPGMTVSTDEDKDSIQ